MNLSKEEQLIALKGKADMLGITYHPSSGIDSLRAKIKAKQDSFAKEDPVDTGITPQKSEGALRVEKQKIASKLVRVNIASNDPNKKAWEGEIITAGNNSVGFFKKFVPFDTDWHIPEILLRTMQDKVCQVYTPFKDAKGNKSSKAKLVKAYSIEILEPLTVSELEALAQEQRATGRLED